MKKRIKIIDLLCLKSNNEEMPKKIKYDGVIYTWGYDTYTTCPDKSPDKQMNNSIFQRYRIDYILNNEVEILDEEDKDIPLIPDDELIILKQSKTVDMQYAIDFNFKVLKEKINRVVKEFNELEKRMNNGFMD